MGIVTSTVTKTVTKDERGGFVGRGGGLFREPDVGTAMYPRQLPSSRNEGDFAAGGPPI